jgi:hypothetical protein
MKNLLYPGVFSPKSGNHRFQVSSTTVFLTLSAFGCYLQRSLVRNRQEDMGDWKLSRVPNTSTQLHVHVHNGMHNSAASNKRCTVIAFTVLLLFFSFIQNIDQRWQRTAWQCKQQHHQLSISNLDRKLDALSTYFMTGVSRYLQRNNSSIAWSTCIRRRRLIVVVISFQ